MDPFTASTAVVPLISLAGSCLSQCYRYGCSVAGAPEESRRLLEELVTLSGILVGLQALSQDALGPQQQPNDSISNLKEGTYACHTALDELKKHLEKALTSDSRTKAALKRAVWPLKKLETLSLVDRIERVKTNLNLMVGSLSTRLIVDQQSVIKNMATNVRDLTNRMELDSHVSKRRQILDWLTTYDHEAAHRRAAETRCEHTGSWMLEDETFNQWLNSSKGGGLWINGLAGYGKTTLTSLVIDFLGDLQDASLSELSYFYFDANKFRKPSCDYLLRFRHPTILCYATVTASTTRRRLRIPVGQTRLSSTIRTSAAPEPARRHHLIPPFEYHRRGRN